jgi:hypothetical protein
MNVIANQFARGRTAVRPYTANQNDCSMNFQNNPKNYLSVWLP